MLTSTQRKYLKSLAHDRKPVVIIGSKGLTDAVMAEIDVALDVHELIKVRINAKDRESREEMEQKICADSQAEMVQRVGHVMTLFKQNLDSQRIVLTKR